jgi:hypothetical protein
VAHRPARFHLLGTSVSLTRERRAHALPLGER